MAIDENLLIQEAYQRVQTRFSGLVLDSFNVVCDVVFHRNFWRPHAIRTLLLAESHVYTADNENDFLIDYPDELGRHNIPRKFVRLVYCLGYGEQSLAPHAMDNAGTWQFWKIFAACASDTAEIDFDQVMIGKNKPDQKRMLDKVSILRKLREKGVWMVDCSSVSLYGTEIKRSSKQKRDILRICWETYTRHLLEDVKPEYVIVVGKRVGKIVEPELIRMGMPYKILSQPQDHLSSAEHTEILHTYQRICNRKSD